MNSNFYKDCLSHVPQDTVIKIGKISKMSMIKIPKGSFIIGSEDSKYRTYPDDEKPSQLVTIDNDFLMGKYPITQHQWSIIVRNTPKVNLDLNPDPSWFNGSSYPVESVNWYEAIELCQRLTKLTGSVINLPSEKQWEYACRAGTNTDYYVGNCITKNLANYESYTVKPVGSYPPNPFGLYDMHGNIGEWCLETYNQNEYTTYENIRPHNRNIASMPKVVRGGSWYHIVEYSRSAYKLDYDPYTRSRTVGLRVVMNLN